ncbi:hypothetical protein VCE7224_00035 [Vibrio celticus]|uniref:DUF58 domain-containing protein n=2 Tax=Vibrio celticus TaxID=446372 RepID=A0A1C3J844_9VIBR|nr:hypothetical protein VCE7224_00035 [Vibrio celticus]
MMLPAHSNGYDLCLKELLHYRQASVRWMPPARSIWSHLSGYHPSSKKGRGMDFAEVRPYQLGDDVRSIDWRITARTGKPYTKLYTEESERPTMLVVDVSTSMQMGTKLLYKSVQAGHLASLLCWLSVAQKDRIGGIIFNQHEVKDCAPVARQDGVLHLLNALITLNSMPAEPHSSSQHSALIFERVLEQLTRLCPKGSDVIFISDFLGLSPRAENVMLRLAKHNSIRLVHISDPIEQGDTSFRQQAWVADSTGYCRINFGNSSHRESLKQDFEQRITHLAHVSRRLQASFYQLSSGDSLVDQLGGLHDK